MYHKSCYVRLLWCFLLVSQFILLRAAEAQTAIQLGRLTQGQVLVRTLPKGAWHSASLQERRLWLAAEPRGAISVSRVRIQTESPDGKYAAEDLDNLDGRTTITTFQIVRPAFELNTLVLNAKTIDRIAITPGSFHHFLYFGGWLPDSRHFVVMEHSSNSGSEFQTRCIIDLLSHRRISFNGWLSKSGRVAIVPNVEGEVHEDQSIRYGNKNGVGTYVPFVSKFHYFAVKMSGQNIAFYRLHNKSGKELHHDGKPFQLDLCQPEVEFSKDDKWAICRDLSDKVYLVSIATGSVTKIIGENAHFL